MTGLVMVTGADGYLGLRTAQRLLAETEDRLLLTVRAADAAGLSDKRAKLASVLDGNERRVEVVPADLTADAPLAGRSRSVTAIVHSAARTAFNQPREDARLVNVEGSLRVAEYAASCPGLERFVFLSTLVSAGHRTGFVPEEAFAQEHTHANHYEWSKEQAERLIAERFADLPLSIARLSTIVSDDGRGEVTQHNAFHNTFKLLFYGLLTVIPGMPDTRLYLATASATCAALVRLTRPTSPTGVYHLAPRPEDAVTLREAIDSAFDVFETDAAFTRRRLLRPEFCDLETFRQLVLAADSVPSSPAASALRTVAPFAEQLFSPKSFASARLTAQTPDAPRFAEPGLVTSVTESLVRTRWGRRPAEPSGNEQERNSVPCP